MILVEKFLNFLYNYIKKSNFSALQTLVQMKVKQSGNKMVTNNTFTPLMTSSPLISGKLEKELIDEKNKVYRRQGLIGKGLDKTKALINVGSQKCPTQN